MMKLASLIMSFCKLTFELHWLVHLGTVGDDDFFKSDMNWEEYWRLLFKKITEEDIVQFEQKYKESEEEREDIKKLYEEYKVCLYINRAKCT